MWFYDCDADGWSLDDKRTPLLPEEKLGAIPTAALNEEEHTKNNLADVLARWRDRNKAERVRTRTAQSFCVSKEDVSAQGYDLSINRYKDVEHKEQQYRTPQQIIAEFSARESQILQEMSELKKALG